MKPCILRAGVARRQNHDETQHPNHPRDSSRCLSFHDRVPRRSRIVAALAGHEFIPLIPPGQVDKANG